jgi:Mn2+/Fe2+ NRAMP family transporter
MAHEIVENAGERVEPEATGVRRVLRALGPGVTTGAADDDPSGVTTYSVAGAQFGTSFLWSAFITWPLMAGVQMMCARIGMVTGMGLAGALREKFPRWVVGLIAVALLIANTINIASDLAGMADAAEMLGGGSSHAYVWIFGLGICAATVLLRYHQIASVLRWLALGLFAYIITAFLVHPDWTAIGRDAFLPHWPQGSKAWATLVALLGTGISPYLFFWQAGQEVEEERAKGRRLLRNRQDATHAEIVDRRIDVGIGTFFSNIVMFFIILTTALTLHRHGVTDIATTRDAAQALRPLAGDTRISCTRWESSGQDSSRYPRWPALPRMHLQRRSTGHTGSMKNSRTRSRSMRSSSWQPSPARVSIC